MKKYRVQMVAGGIFIAVAAIFFLTVWNRENMPTLNMTAKGTKAKVVIDAGHGGIQTRPKKSGLAQVGGWWESCTDIGYTHLSYKQSIQGVNL